MDAGALRTALHSSWPSPIDHAAALDRARCHLRAELRLLNELQPAPGGSGTLRLCP